MTEPWTTLRVEERDDRVIVTLDRPQARNAINSAMIAELHEVCRLLEDHPRPLLLTGSGTSFAGGADIAELARRTSADALAGINSRLFDRVARLPMPTVAAVNGHALGGGAELAYACDLRLAGPSAVFGNPEPGLGIIAAAGACWRLRELVGLSIAKQVLLGGGRLDAPTALHVGLVTEVVPEDELLAAAHRTLDRMAQWSPMALRLTKLALDAGEPHPAIDDVAQALLFDSVDKNERMTSFLTRRQKS
jgi:enoyl-CoA hydratase/carnithine racemase